MYPLSEIIYQIIAPAVDILKASIPYQKVVTRELLLQWVYSEKVSPIRK
jgi:hypothetical protein